MNTQNHSIIFLLMIFLHILDDFFLQSAWLVNGKQKSWWEQNAPDEMYAHDYVVCLLAHSFSWTFMMMGIPSILFKVSSSCSPLAWVLLFILNVTVHAMIDDLKANRKCINLIIDQMLHIGQIVTTFIFIFV